MGSGLSGFAGESLFLFGSQGIEGGKNAPRRSVKTQVFTGIEEIFNDWPPAEDALGDNGGGGFTEKPGTVVTESKTVEEIFHEG